MGLDMYLYFDRYVWQGFEENDPPAIEIKAITDKGKESTVSLDLKKVKSIVEEVGYWRKANAIHQWFVDNCQDGIDDCRQAYVPVEKLEELLTTVNHILDGKNSVLAHRLLPPQEGFFFGSTNIDNWYWEDLKLTKEILEQALVKAKECPMGTFKYQSSW